MNLIGIRLLCGSALLFPLALPAVMVSPTGQGEVLIYPYFDARNGQQTVLSVVNGDYSGKAIKLHVREAQNGRPVATLNLYLGEYDVWTALLFTAPDGRPALLTQDNSCTVPAIKTSTVLPQLPDGSRYLPLSSASYTGANADLGSATTERAASGFIEMVEMGALVNHSLSDQYATHINGVPFGCAMLEAAWRDGRDGYWVRDPLIDLAPPTGALSGSVSVTHLADRSAYRIHATAIGGFSVVVQHSAPGQALPDLSSAVTETARMQVESTVVVNGRIVHSRWPQERAIDAVSAALSQSGQRAEFSVEASQGARTDWLITLPTRRYYTDRQLVSTATPPFTVRFSGTGHCEYASSTPYDREARRPIGDIDFGGITPPRPCLCASTQLWSVGGERVFGNEGIACAANPLPVIFGDVQLDGGFFNVGLAGNGHRSRMALDGEQFDGLPAIGFTILRTQASSAARGSSVERGAQSVVASSGCTRGLTDCTQP